jgi:hypothetical protein
MKDIPIVEASDDQLKWFTQNVLQLTDVPSDRAGLIGAIINAGHKADTIIVEGESDQSAEAPTSAFAPQPLQPSEQVYKMPLTGFGYWRNSPMVQLRIMSTDRPGGNEPAHPTVNGSPCMVIQRNRLVEIPYDFYLVLKQAGGTKVQPGEKPTDDLVRTDYLEYPLQDVVMPSREEIAKWQAYTGAHELGKAKPQAAAA